MKNKTMKPLVSVIMPVYNAGDFLVEAIKSILNQTYKNFELIIINDASNDNSWQIISKFKKQYPKKIKAVRLKRNLNKGGDVCANIAFTMARGEFVARMDADDIACSQRLEKQVNYLLTHPNIFMVGSQAWVINRQGEVIGEKKVPLGSESIYKNYSIFHPMIHSSVMLRKDEIKRKNLYQIKYSANNDLLTFFEFLKTKKFVNLTDKLIYYRVHGKNDSLTSIKTKYLNTLKIRLRAVRKLGYKPSFKAIVLNLVQFLTVMFLPEKILFLIYMLAKGIYTPGQLVEKLIGKILAGFLPASIRVKLNYEQA